MKNNLLKILLLLSGVVILLTIVVKKLNISSNINNKNEDPLLTEIKNQLIIPFCETKGGLTEDNIQKFFSQEYINSWNGDNPEEIGNNTEDSNALYRAKKIYKDLFIENSPNFECLYLKNNTKQTIKESLQKRERPEEEDYHWDYEYIFSPNESLSAKIPIVKEQNIWKLRFAWITVNYSIENN